MEKMDIIASHQFKQKTYKSNDFLYSFDTCKAASPV